MSHAPVTARTELGCHASSWRSHFSIPRRLFRHTVCCASAQIPAAITEAHTAAATTLAAAAVAAAATSRRARLASASSQPRRAASAAFSNSTSLSVVPAPPEHTTRPSTTSNTSAAIPTTPSSTSSPVLEGRPVDWVSLGPSLDLIQQRLLIGGATFSLLAPRDVDAVIDLYLDLGLHDADPYWTRAWPSAIALASTLLQRPELVAGRVVADLGAGLGLAGMAAIMAGAREVVLLDREPAALQCALLSAAASGLDAEPEPRSEGHGFEVRDLNPVECDKHSLLDTSVRLPYGVHSSRSSGNIHSSKDNSRRVEALPLEQLPSYTILQLMPPYRDLLLTSSTSIQYEQGSEESHPPLQQHLGREREWEVLMALARALGRSGSEPKQQGSRTSEETGHVGCSSRNDGGNGDSAAAAVDAAAVAAVVEDSTGESVIPLQLHSSHRLTAEAASAWADDTLHLPNLDNSSRCNSSFGTHSKNNNGRNNSSSYSNDGTPSMYGSVLRAHVFDWTAPPDMGQLLPPLQQQQPRGVRQRLFDVVLACDVLYEDAAVGPIADLMPLLLRPDGGRLLLADPPNRTLPNRERFLNELRQGSLKLSVEECSLQQCEVSKLDNEMAGGLAPSVETVPVQLLVFRSGLGNDTVGVKLP